jgi:DNA primase
MKHRYEDQIKSLLTVVHTAGTEAMCFCPFHDNKNTPSLQINLDTGLWVCFVCTTDKGKRLGGPFKRLTDLLGERYIEPEVDAEQILRALDELEAEPEPMPVYSEGKLKKFLAVPTDYWGAKRGFDPHTIREWQLGFDPFHNAGVIPMRNYRGELLGVTLRYLTGSIKYMYPRGFPRRHELFGAHKVTEGRIALVEGPLDVISCWQAGVQAVGQFGSSLSEEQANLIRRMGVSEVVLMHDNDAAGHKAATQAFSLLDGLLMLRPTYPPGAKDPGELDDSTISSMFQGNDYLLAM